MPVNPNLYTLLVIEDNDGDVFLIRKAIEDYGIPAEMTVCSDGESALRLIDSEHPPAVDAIILDLAIPRIEGLDVLRTISNRPLWVDVPVMVFTSSPSPGDKHRVQLLGRARYVEKPTSLDGFLREIGDNVSAMLSERQVRPVLEAALPTDSI